MASLGHICSPATACFPVERQLPFTPLSFPNNIQFYHTHFSVSCLPCTFFLTHTANSLKLPVTTKRVVNNNFARHFSSTAQEQALESTPVSGSGKSEELESDTEEVYKDRLRVDNVPWDYTPEDILALFKKYGTVVDVEISRHNKTKNSGRALVTMASAEEALAALNNLQSRSKYKVGTSKQPTLEVTYDLFVANLSFEATDKDLREFFTSEGHSVVSTEVVFNENPRRSLGYGFVSFKSKNEADEALSSVEGKEFMGRPIRGKRRKPFVRVREPATESAESENTCRS
ncbi:33 kDa ribonucleoprotein, chloroplastic-like isoform X2 [Humulus lupulus]|uniref:33 kDa ribonucleoprotein, chloroplastic-like isoform X2 n=1 Tax=Humulus lupulus TaxID=3486 RepID=UPI002B411D14|nr:33 kDa ribonucleoprotein, chloroplastic-like isoform X2 [Humulus lupulus]